MGQLAAMAERQSPAVTEVPQVSQRDGVETRERRGHLVSTVLCKDIANSMTDNTPVIYHVLMAVVADRLPCVQQLTAATFWLFDDPGAYQITMHLLTPAGDPLLEASAEVAVQTPGTYHLSTFHFGAVAFPLLGRYRAEVFLDGELAGAYPLFVQPLPGLAAEAEGGAEDA